MKSIVKRLWLLLPGLLLALGAVPANAGDPAALDGPPPKNADPLTVLETPLFGLGEVNLSSLGVSPAELLDVGPQLAPTSSIGGGMLMVDDDGLDCPNAQYTSVQAAVTGADPGDKIKVCRGTYMEQVTIDKDGLTLFSEAAFQAIIKPPLTPMAEPKAIVRVNGARDVTIRHFTISGPGTGPCDSLRYGVRVDNDGSALITDNHITKIHDTPFSGCQNGLAVDVGRVLVDGPTSGNATVVHNLIDEYQKGGVVVDNADSTAEVAYNEVVGGGPLDAPGPAQNGIQVSRGAQGDVHHNKVSRNFFTPTSTSATGILLFSDPRARVHHNEVFLNENGIGTSMVDGTAEISYNNSRQNLDGIVAFSPTMDVLISYNKAFQNTRYDCRDDNAPSSNQWVKDLGRTESQPGLCKQAGPQ